MPATNYATAVMDVLDHWFPDLTADDRDIITRAIDANTRDPQPSFEAIVDDARSARWRLKADSADRRRVRLAYYPARPPGSSDGQMREAAVNLCLRTLAGPAAGTAEAGQLLGGGDPPPPDPDGGQQQ